ncbi:zinc-finger protein [Coemansia sp. RSA 1813]|nr:zinc-finger protein [Coemansia sp. RSA 1646]KAJ1771247.1 zinc-finger protein [Coemansia sp. RSA 1843]KAJ2092816.1 zinc-finger protein [Coemansia sp. RSA 986]KAJ2217684.1 zinc-finger protein [Coemansia sp. RSA 487]KAJ2573078.1 zinc-finger protein [Coemansia sp. RSA 1813]
MADLHLEGEGVANAQEREYSARLPPLHGHVQGQESTECESAGCTLPLKLPSLSALGIKDTIRTVLTKPPPETSTTSSRIIDGVNLAQVPRAEYLQQTAASGNRTEAADHQPPNQTTANQGRALDILAAVSFQSENRPGPTATAPEDLVNSCRASTAASRSEGGLASSVQRCLWSTCTQIFNSIDELVRHLYKLHVATNRTSVYSWAALANDQQQARQPASDASPSSQALDFMCKWESCETRAHGADELIDHVCKDHLDAEQVLHRCGWTGCGCEYETIDLLTEHLSAEHIGSGHSTYVCRWEGCERAEKPFAQRQRALRHIQTHTGAKPFSCQVCTKRFSEAHIMQQHLRVHTGEKPFKCAQSGCGKEFAVSSALTIHRRTHTGEKPYECRFDGCSRRFAESSNLTKHMRIHTGERPFKCPQTECGKTFSRPDQVSRHRRIHTGQKPLPCPVDQCNKKFMTPSTRLNHLRTLHPSALHSHLPEPESVPISGDDWEQAAKHPRLSPQE